MGLAQDTVKVGEVDIQHSEIERDWKKSENKTMACVFLKELRISKNSLQEK